CHSVDVDACDKAARTPVDYAVLRGNVRVATALVRRGAHLNLIRSKTDTPLFSAVMKTVEALGLVEALLAGGASCVIPNQDGWLPLHATAHRGHARIVTLLLDKSATSIEASGRNQ
ncbi:hypothetical protein PybrP1_008961, partial [[Pythium] brassicae (nom. inval.)]